MKKRNIILTVFFLFSGVWMNNTNAFDMKDIEIHGFISQGYMKSDENNFLAETKDGTFQFNELGINFSTEPVEKLRIGMQILSRDLGDIGENEIMIDWAFADYRWKDWLGLRAGKIKTPIGFYNETRDVDSLRTSILLPQSVYPERYRDAILALQGAGLYGDILMGAMGNLSYQFQCGTIDIDKDSNAAKEAEMGGLFDITGFDIDDDVWAGSVRWDTPLDSLRIGASMLNVSLDIGVKTMYPLQFNPQIPAIPAGTPMTIEISDYTFKTFSMEYIWRDLTLSSEYAVISTKTRTTLYSQTVFPESENESEGYYINASYRFADWFELGAYYSEYYADKDDKDGKTFTPDYSAWLKDFALTTRFDINKNWTFKLEGHAMNGTAMLLPTENPEGAEKDWFLFTAKTTFTF